MQNPQKLLIAVVLSIFIGTLVACGGGGGGSSFTPIAYTGSAALATIDGSNAGDFAALAEYGSGLSGVAPVTVAVAPGEDAAAGIPASVLQAVTALNKKLPGYLAQAPIEGSAALAETQSETLFCGAGTGSDGSMYLTVTLNASGSASASITYSSCDDGFGVVFNGGMSMTISDIDGDPSLAPLNMTATYNNLQMYFQDTLETITVYAAMSMVEDFTGANDVYSQTISDMIMAESPSGLTARISNYVLTVVDYVTYEVITISSAASKAKIYDHNFGYVEMYTSTPLLSDFLGPYAGVVRMDGENGSWAEVDFGITCDAVTDNGTYFDGVNPIGSFCYIPN